jgi:hypothetical protein
MKHLLPLLLMILMLGCGKSPVVGEWKGNLASISGAPKTVIINFNSDNTFAYQIDAVASGGSVGTYEVKDKTILLTANKVAGMEVSKADQTAQTATLSEDGKSFTLGGTTFTKQ